MGVGAARAFLGKKPKQDPRPWVRGCEPELSSFNQAASRACIRKRQADSWEEWRDCCRANVDVWRGLGLRKLNGGMLKHNRFRTKPIKGTPLGFWTFKELCSHGSSSSLGEVHPTDAQVERDALAKHFRLIGEGPVLVADRVWDNVSSYSPMDVVWARPSPQRTSCMV